MIITNWKRAGVGACTAAALVVGAGLAFAPVANAAPATSPISTTGSGSGLVVGVVTGATGALTTPTAGSSSPITIGTGGGGIAVGVGGTTVGVGTIGTGVGAGVTTGDGSGVGVVIGGSTSTTVTGTPSTPGTPGAPGLPGTPGTPGTPGSTGGTPSSTPTDGTQGSQPSSTPIVLTALSVVAQYKVVYPSKDGYRDAVRFALNGTTSDGQQHAASGIAKLVFGSTTVATWPITATNQVITWSGTQGGKVVPGRYVFTATIGNGSNSVSGTDSVDVSAKKLASSTSLVTSKSVSGTHRMAAKPLEGLKHGKVTLRIISSATHVKGKQYLVFKHGAKKIKVRILNGKHTSKAVTLPKSFTTYTISHTWKKHTVKIKSLKYKYSYKALK